MAVAVVRQAVESDAGVVAGLQLAVWQQVYAELLPAAVLLADPEVRAAAWAARIGGGAPVLLASEGAEPVGLAAVADPDPDPDDNAGDNPAGHTAVGRVGEIETLLVLPRWARRGHGGRLLAEAAAGLRRRGAESARWWAPEADRSVERFLAGVSWFPDGGRRVLDTGEGSLAEVRYAGPLDLVLH